MRPTTLVLLDNQTPHTLRLGNQHVESGSWPGSGQPPSRIRPNERVMFGSISKWVGDAEAHVSYQIEGSEADHISAAQVVLTNPLRGLTKRLRVQMSSGRTRWSS